MSRDVDPRAAIPAALALAAGLLTQPILHSPSLAATFGFFGVVALAGGATWRLTQAPGLGLSVAATISLWTPLRVADLEVLAAAAAMAGLLAVPLRHRATQVATAAGATLLLAWLAVPRPLIVAGAAATAAAIAALRPQHPTRDGLRAIHWTALVLPSSALASLLAINAVTQRAEGPDVTHALYLTIGITGLLGLLGLALLGLATYLASSHRLQVNAWVSLAVVFAVVAASFALRSGTMTLSIMAIGAVPLAHLAVVFGKRLEATTRRVPWSLVLPMVAVLLQWGLAPRPGVGPV